MDILKPQCCVTCGSNAITNNKCIYCGTLYYIAKTETKYSHQPNYSSGTVSIDASSPYKFTL